MSKQIVSYLVLRDTDAYSLAEKTKQQINRYGYELVGGIQTDPAHLPGKTNYYQCVVKYKEN